MAQLKPNQSAQWGTQRQPLWVEPYTQIWKRARQIPALPSGRHTINPPDQKPELPKFTWTMIVTPLASLGLMALLYYFFFKGRVGYLVLMIPTTVISVGGTVAKYFSNKKQYYARIEHRKQEYKNYLSWECERLDQMLATQERMLAQINPSPQEWYQRILQGSPQVWERSLIDTDYQSVRVGLSAVSASFQVVPPSDNTNTDMLIDTAKSLSNGYKAVQAPLTVNLSASSLAVVGDQRERNNLLRAIMVQMTATHSPEDIRIAVLCPGYAIREWSWARWLPHTWTQDHTRRLIANDELQAEAVTERLLNEIKGSTAHWYVVIPDPILLTGKFMGVLLAALQNPDNQLHLITTTANPQLTPNICRSIIVLDDRSKSSLWLIGPPRQEISFIADSVNIYEAEAYARASAPLKMVATGTGDIPDTVPLFDLFGDGFSTDAVLENWNNASLKDLRVPIGLRAGGKMMVLDLHETGHGPHGLIAGTTGSGKSELIQTLVVSLAAHFPPDQLAFMLIDYKGGGTGQAFAGLPHLAGTISNLDESLAKRALVALKTEVEKRQHIFNKYQITHIDDYLKLYRAGNAYEVLPRLVIIVDEFAELAKSMTDFLPELVSIARVGRSLGVHLILATQKPAGVVNDQIWSNARFKLCLKVQDVGDSKEMLKKPDAAFLTRPGRAYIMVGHDEMYEQFQSGYGGVAAKEGGSEDDLRIFHVGLDGSQTLANTPINLHQVVEHKTQISEAVNQIKKAFTDGNYPAPAALWVAPLGKKLNIAELPETDTERIVIGMADDPVAVKQIPLTIDLNEGHLQIIGAPGTGKSTALQTIVLSLAKTMTPKKVAVYVLDLDKRNLRVLEGLPHVGAVVLSYEEERMNRLFLNMQNFVNERRAMNPAELDNQRWIILVIDNFPALMELSESMQEMVSRLSREAGGLKMMLILTSTTMLNYRISSNFSQAIALNLIDPSEYTMLVGPNPPRPAHLPGRGLVRASRPMEVQIAAPARGDNYIETAKNIDETVSTIRREWKGRQVMQIPAKPDVFHWETLQTPSSRVSLGIHRVTLRNFAVSIQGGEYITITGTAGGGKTNLLLNMAVGFGKNKTANELALYVASPESRGLYYASYLPQTVAFAKNLKETETLLGYVSAHLQNPDGRQVVLLLDNFDLVYRANIEAFRDIIGYGHQYGLTAICAGPAQVMAGGDRILRVLRERNAIWLGEIDPIDAAAFGFTRQRKGGKGSGYIKLNGRFAPLQTAIINNPEGVIKSIQAKYKKLESIPEGVKV